jgi:hypothetical protein
MLLLNLLHFGLKHKRPPPLNLSPIFRLQAPAAAEGASGEEAKDSWEDLEVPVLQSSLEEHSIVDVEPRAEEPLEGEPEMKEDAAQ